MKQSLIWRGGFILVVIAFAAWSMFPMGEKIRLGLDLQGGMHMALQVETDDALTAERDQDMDSLRARLEEEGIAGVGARVTGETAFELTGVPRDQDSLVKEQAERMFGSAGLLATQIGRWDWQRSGDVIRFDMTSANIDDIKNKSVDQALETIRNRVDAFGVAEPIIARQGAKGERLVVQLPGVDEPERVRNLIKSTAFLEFHLVDEAANGGLPTREDVLALYGGALPEEVEIYPEDLRNESDEIVGRRYWPLEKLRAITGRDLRNARPGLGQTGTPVVDFYLTPEGARKFGDFTGANVNRLMAIVLDGKVQSAPVIRSRISDQGYIEGGFTQAEAEDLSTKLRSGALPAGITELEERTVGPSLGQDSIEQGRRAGLIGAVAVVLAMLLVYKLSGINAVIVLSMNVVLVFGILAAVGATLTLPGIAGIILTIGMAVDANVLVFERIREELRTGRTVKTAIDSGFKKALSSILDANVTTLIAALFLFQFGTGPIRGFAVTLSIGIMASLFTAVFVSRWIFDMITSRRARVEKLSI